MKSVIGAYKQNSIGIGSDEMSVLIKGMDMPREDGTYVFAINILNGCAECVYWLKEDGGVSYRVVEVPTENNDTIESE